MTCNVPGNVSNLQYGGTLRQQGFKMGLPFRKSWCLMLKEFHQSYLCLQHKMSWSSSSLRIKLFKDT